MPEELRSPWSRTEGDPATSQQQLAQLVEKKMSDIKSGADTSDTASAMLVFASYFLNHPYPEFHEEFAVLDNGTISMPPMDAADILSGKDPGISILNWTHTDDQYTPEQVRAAASSFTEAYPQVFFKFTESPDRKKFSYVATLG